MLRRVVPQARVVAVAVLSVLALPGLTACGQEDTRGEEAGVDIGELQEDIGSYDGDEVTVSAQVNRIISPGAFTIAGTDETSVDALLVVHGEVNEALQQDYTAEVSGIAHQAFDLAAVEEELGEDLDPAAFEGWAGEPYIEATSIELFVAPEG